jgi:hypothetical protein
MKVIFKKLREIKNKRYDSEIVRFSLSKEMEYLFDGVTVREVWKEKDYYRYTDRNDKATEWYIDESWFKKDDFSDIERMFNIEL